MRDLAKQLAAERTVSMILMHAIVQVTTGLVMETEDEAVATEVYDLIAATIRNTTEPADARLLDGTDVAPAEAAAYARERATAMLEAIRMGVTSSVAVASGERH